MTDSSSPSATFEARLAQMAADANETKRLTEESLAASQAQIAASQVVREQTRVALEQTEATIARSEATLADLDARLTELERYYAERRQAEKEYREKQTQRARARVIARNSQNDVPMPDASPDAQPLQRKPSVHGRSTRSSFRE
jgi:chromosome segregation ATPase